MSTSEPENQSKIARLLQQIQQEYEAAQRGLSGLAFGTSKHVFITARMENMGRYHAELTRHVGERKATELVNEALADL